MTKVIIILLSIILISTVWIWMSPATHDQFNKLLDFTDGVFISLLIVTIFGELNGE